MSELPGIGIPPSETEPTPALGGGQPFVASPLPGGGKVTVGLRKPEPEAPDTTATPDLGELAILIVVLGLVAFAKAISDFLNWLFRTMLGPLWPRTGRKQVSPQLLTQGLSNALGTEFQKLDSKLGMNLTRMGDTAGLMGQAIYQIGVAVQLAAETVARLEGRTGKTENAQNALRHAQQTDRQKLTQTQAQVAAQGKHDAEALRAVREDLHRLQEHVTRVIEPELDGLRHAIPQLEKGSVALWGEVEKHSEAIGLAGASAMVAAALARLGGSWIRCDNTRAVGEAVCGMDANLVRRLLAGLLPALALADLCALADGVLRAAETLQPAMMAFVDVEDALIGCHGFDKAKAIPLARVSPTPVYATVTL